MPASGALDGLIVLIIADTVDSVESLIESLRASGAVVAAVRLPRLALAYSDRHPIDAKIKTLHVIGLAS
jgi:hypothetical protein